MSLIVREAGLADLDDLQNLYLHLKQEAKLPDTGALRGLWQAMVSDPSHHIFLGAIDGKIVATCTLVVIKNLTHQMRPYALIENVVTHSDYRRRGYGAAVLKKAVECAKINCCYKVMLLTGSKQPGTLKFYEQSGFNKNDKTAFILWL